MLRGPHVSCVWRWYATRRTGERPDPANAGGAMPRSFIPRRARRGRDLDRPTDFANSGADEENLRRSLGWQADVKKPGFVCRANLDAQATVVRNECGRGGENNPGGLLFARRVAVKDDWHNAGKSTVVARRNTEGGDSTRVIEPISTLDPAATVAEALDPGVATPDTRTVSDSLTRPTLGRCGAPRRRCGCR